MDQSTTPKPVMDVTPPKPATPAPSPDVSPALASHRSETVAASQGGSDRCEAAPTLREPTRNGEGYANGITAEPGASGREQGGGSTKAEQDKDPLAVHQAPPLSDDDKTSTASGSDAAPQPEQKPTAHTAAPKPHGPAAAITTVILAMLLLSALAVLVYLNS